MKHTVLSDHVADRLRQKEIRRQQQHAKALTTYKERCKNADMAYEDTVKAYECAVHKRRQGIDLIKKKRKEAWKQRAWRQTVKYALQSVFATISGRPNMPEKPRRPPPPIKKSFDEDDYILQSGQAGEQQVSDYLEDKLDENWVLFSGYKNRKGEVDRILVGPEGIFAIEIKNINGRIYCDGDEWWKDKYDNYGNLVDWDVPIKDKKGRSPSQQLNEPSDMLQAFLRRTLPSCQIYRAVVLTHQSSRILDLKNLTVNEAVILEYWNLNTTFRRSKFKMSRSEVDEAAKKIEADHRYNYQNANKKAV